MYRIENDNLVPVRFVVLNVNGRLRRRSNPTPADCRAAGVSAYEYVSGTMPEYDPSLQTVSHSYAVVDGAITDVWTVTDNE